MFVWDVEVYFVLLQLTLSCPELFELVVNDTGKACGFIVAVLHFSAPTNLVPAALEGLCVNFHCHVQGRAAQGQLIAFIIMISRQIYCACLKSADQGLRKMCLQLLARLILLFQSAFLTQFTRLEVNRWDLASSSSPTVYNFTTPSAKSPTECVCLLLWNAH